jgi:hypothetical protein
VRHDKFTLIPCIRFQIEDAPGKQVGSDVIDSIIRCPIDGCSPKIISRLGRGKSKYAFFVLDAKKRQRLFPGTLSFYTVPDFYVGIVVIVALDIPFKSKTGKRWGLNNKLPRPDLIPFANAFS